MTGFSVLIGICVLIAAITHACIPRYIIASILAAFISITFFLGVAALIMGHVDEFILVMFFAGGFYSLCISLLIGIPVAIFRKRRQPPPPGHCRNCGYDLTGNVSGICPECGRAIDARSKADR